MVKIDFEIHGALLAILIIAVVALICVCMEAITPTDEWRPPTDSPPKWGRMHPANQHYDWARDGSVPWAGREFAYSELKQ